MDAADLQASSEVADLSTLLVATIQETKDRLHHLELLFCSRLFPSFQSRSLALSEALARESALLRQIDDLRCDARRDLEESARRSDALIAELRERLDAKAAEAAERKEMTERLLRQLDEKESDLAAERSKRRRADELWRDLRERYRNLKSQHKFLMRKTGLVVLEDDDDDGSCSPTSRSEKKGRLLCVKEKNEANTPISADKSKGKSANDFQERANNTDDKPLLHSPDVSSRCQPTSPASTSTVDKYPDVKPQKSVGAKRSNPSWRDTRINQDPRGLDPHDDFLNTPMEIARENLKKDPPEAKDVSALPPNDMVINSSDDETQDVHVQAAVEKQQVSIQRLPERSFKYVEPVRKKAERENLKGVECKQCKKFYDAVHPDADRNGTAIRCEHHEGVSRHRYRYVPPSTPEGFWNIGFDSDV